MSRRVLAILGAGGHAKVVADLAIEAGWHDVVFFDDRYPNIQRAGQWAVEGVLDDIEHSRRNVGGVLVAIGNNEVRLDWCQRIAKSHHELVTLVHPRAYVSRYANIGPGSVVMAGAVINIDVKIGSGSIINSGATVDHDCHLGNGVHISPGAHLAGSVVVGDLTWIGIGASIKEGVIVGSRAIIGAGSAVIASVEDDHTVVGVPARPIFSN